MRAKMIAIGLLATAWSLWAIQHDPYPVRQGPTASEIQAHQDKACESLWRLHSADEPWCRKP